MTDNVTLLLVDDLEENLVAMEALLRGPAVRVLKARSGEEALELLLVHEVALALVDVQMPGMDGFELAELMRGSERTKHVPIVFVTAGAHDRKRMFRGYDSGAVDFLYKPVEPHILTNKVNVFVELFRQKQALARVSTLQRAIFNSANFSSIATDAKGVIQIFNVGAERMLGYTAAEVMNKITPADISDPQEVIARAKVLSVELGTPIAPGFDALVFKASRGIEDIYELTYIRKDGSRFPAVVSVTALRDAQDAIIGYLLIGSDNTARKQASQYVRSLIEASLDPLVTISVEGKITDVNEGSIKVTGMAREKLIGTDFSDYFTEPEQAREGYQQVFAKGLVTDYPLTIRHEDGRLTDVLYNASVYKDVSGNVLGVFAAARDITARKQAELAVNTSELRYRRLFETGKDGILLLDANTGKITDANPFMSELLEYPRDEFIGKELWQIGLFKDKAVSETCFLELQQKGYIRYEHLPLETKSGRRTEVEFVSNVYEVDDWKVAQCNIRDISDRIRLEEKTHEQAIALADLHRRKDDFLAMLSHELRSPLAPIANAVELLQQQPNEDPLQHQARNIIERQVIQLTRLVDDLLEVSRLTTGRVQLRLERLVINGIVERAVETVRPLLDRHRHEFALSLSSMPISLEADPSRLEQVIVNLLTNAAKYTPEGGRIALSVAQDGEECVIRVRDNGVGIAPELLPRIFELFTQAERSLDRSQGGLGIGLALVERLVELHRGHVEVNSALGQGSEFAVYLPTVPFVATQLPIDQTDTVRANRPSLRVLVVDDNLDLTLSMEMLLKAQGHDVRVAYDGPAALKLALEFLPQVALLDIGLPGANGYELATKMREEPTLRDVVLVAATGYGQMSDRQLSLAAGFDHHLVKPAVFAELKSILAGIAASA